MYVYGFNALILALKFLTPPKFMDLRHHSFNYPPKKLICYLPSNLSISELGVTIRSIFNTV